MPRQTQLRILLLFIINCSLLVNLQAQSWQFSKKLGCNKKYTANDRPKLISKLKDSKGNHYLHYYVTGDTFYYDDFSQKRHIKGGDAHAICKIHCDGSLAWSKIITHDRKNQVDLIGDRVKLFFGDNENRIVISGISYTGGTYFHIDSDTAIAAFKEYTIVYDSMGLAVKKFVDKPKSQGRSLATGYLPASHRYFFYEYIDSTSTDRLFFNGKYLSRGEYFIIMDSNMNYFKISPVTLFSKPRVLWDTSEPAELTKYIGHLYPFFILNNKVIMVVDNYFHPNDLYVGQYVVVGNDSFKIYDLINPQLHQIFMCYNDTGGQEWTEFFYGLSGNSTKDIIQDGNEIFIKRDDKGKWLYKGIEIISDLSNGNYQTVVFKIDAKGNFLWKDSIKLQKNIPVGFSLSVDVNNRHELVWNYDLYNNGSSAPWVEVNSIQYKNNMPNPPTGFVYTKNLLVAVGKGTQRVIDTTTDAVRWTETSHVSVDAAGNIWLFGEKKFDGRILNNDSTPLQYGTGNDLFIAKHGQAHCFCDPLASSYKVTDSSIEGRISVQYAGSATDSVVFLWGDGTHSVAKPSNTALTKIYNKTISASIAAVAYNNCYRTDSFRRTIQIKCTAPNAEFILLDSNTKNIRVKYIGTATDTVIYHWGDGNTTRLANPINKITSYSYTTSVDSVYISASIKSICGDRDTFARWYVFCPKPKKSFILDTSRLSSRILSVQYSGADSLWVDWGDDTKSYKPNGIKIYNIYGVYTISVILKTACGRLDTSKYVLTIGSSSIESISKVDIVISPNPASDYIEISPSTVMLNLFQHPTFTLTNILGQSFSPPVIPTQAGISLDVRSLTEGIYILQIRDKNDNLVKTERIVIQRDN
jgi:hypothetical protein